MEGERRWTEAGTVVWLAGMNPGVLEVSRRAGLDQRLGRERMLFNARAAIERYQAVQAEGEVCECEGCTSILVGKGASVDGSTMTSHSCDSTTDRTWMDMVPNQTHKPGAMATLWMDPKESRGPNDPDRVPAGEIPQVPQTYKFLNAAYPIMNEHQLAIGETTFGGKRELKSDDGIIDCPEL